jgi:DNA-binding MarR family transcriptional regulator
MQSMNAKNAGAKDSATKPPLYSGDDYIVDESVGYLIRQVYASMQTQIDAQMNPYDLTAMQWGPLMMLAKGKGDTAAALAREAGTDTGAMTRMLDRLEAKDLVRRARSQEDRRVVHLELTPEGQRIAQQIPYTLSEVLNHFLQGFTATELAALKGYLRRMRENGERELRVNAAHQEETA